MQLRCWPWALQVALVVKNPLANAGNKRDTGSIPGSGRFPWRRAWQPILVFLPGESQAQRSLEGYSPGGRKETLLLVLVSHFSHAQLCATP